MCTGNICRSPMGEGILSHLLSERGVRGISVESAGVAGWAHSPAMPEAVEALRRSGIDISAHAARHLARAMVESADLVLTMTAEHRADVQAMAPASESRTFSLKEFVALIESLELNPDGDEKERGSPHSWKDARRSEERLREVVERAARLRSERGEVPVDEDIADPIGLSLHAFEATAWELRDLFERLIDRVFPLPADASLADAGFRSGGAATDDPERS